MHTQPHQSVLFNEILFAFEKTDLNIFVDCTLGAGGHSEGILEAHPEIAIHVGIDQDPNALQIAQERLAPWSGKLKLTHGNFADLAKILQQLQIKQVQGIIIDLGVSSMQLDKAERGFSFMREGPLDMRMNPEAELTAAEVVNTYSEQELGKIFREYGEEKQWRAAARAIVTAREQQPITTTLELAAILRPLFSWKKKGINPLTLIFQGLRIYVNDELNVIEKVLTQAIDLLSPGGRLAVISFHSLEDRIVKNCFRFEADDKYDSYGLGGVFLNKEPRVTLVTRKPICPSEIEVEANPRSRSAKMRVVEKR